MPNEQKVVTHIILKSQRATPIDNASRSGRRHRRVGWLRDQFIFDLAEKRHGGRKYCERRFWFLKMERDVGIDGGGGRGDAAREGGYL